MKGLLFAVATGLLAASGQEMTIPEALAKEGVSITKFQGTPSGHAPTIDWVLKDTHLIVRGTVGETRTYLSADAREILTDYQLSPVQVIYRSQAAAARIPAMSSVTVTLLGGTVALNGLTYTSTHEALPGLAPGQEYVLLLRQDDGRFMVAGRYFEAFRIVDGKVEPSVKKQRFAEELAGQPVADVVTSLVGRAIQAHQKRR